MKRIICAIVCWSTLNFQGCAAGWPKSADEGADYAGYGNPYYSPYNNGMGMMGGMYGNGTGGTTYGNGMYNYDLYGDRMLGYGINGMSGMPAGLGWGGWRF